MLNIFLIQAQVGQRVFMLVKQTGLWSILSSMFQLILLMLAMVANFLKLNRCDQCAWYYLDLVFILCLVWLTEHMQDIIGLLFRHIKLLQQSGVSQWIFDEVLLLLILLSVIKELDTFFLFDCGWSSQLSLKQSFIIKPK